MTEPGGGVVAMARCARIKANGERCKGTAIEGAEWCYSHDPDHEEERRRSASKAGKTGGRGRSGSSSELEEIKDLISGLTRQVLAGEQQTGRAAVAAQLINTRLRAVELERKIKETEELEARLEELERATGSQRGGKRWGA